MKPPSAEGDQGERRGSTHSLQPACASVLARLEGEALVTLALQLEQAGGAHAVFEMVAGARARGQR